MNEKNIICTAYSSLVPLTNWREDKGNNKPSESSDAMKKDNTIKDMADKYGKSEPQILLKWALQRNFAILPKSNNKDRITSNIELFDFNMEDIDISNINSLDKNFSCGFPNGFDPCTFE